METEKNNKTGAQNTNNAQQQGFDLSGLDLSGILPPGTWEVVKPLLPGGIAALGMYFFVIKPLADKVDILATKVQEMQKRLDAQKEYILDVEEKQEELEKDLGSVNDELEKKNDFFETKRRSSYQSSKSKTGNAGDSRKRGLHL